MNKICLVIGCCLLMCLFSCGSFVLKKSDPKVAKKKEYIAVETITGDTVFIGEKLAQKEAKKWIDGTYLYYTNGLITKKVEFNNQRKNGTYIEYFPNGNVKLTGWYISGMKFGSFITFFDNGQIHTVENYNMDLQQGFWLTFNEKGNLTNRVFYENGILVAQE